jgi:integrase
MRERICYLECQVEEGREASRRADTLLARLMDNIPDDLRHTCATLLPTKGVHPKIVSEMLGHSSVAITYDIYSHVIPRLGDAAARVMEDALGD